MFELTPFARNDARRIRAYDPWKEMMRFDRDFWGDANIGFKTDIKDEGDHYLLEAELPGFDKQNIKVDVEDGYMTIKAERSSDTENKDDKTGYIRRERSYGSFSRSFDVSQVAVDGITAEYKDGVLNVTLPKKDESKPNSSSIEIK